MKPIKFIASLFGYTKVPLEAVQLSMYLEDLVDRLARTSAFNRTEPGEYVITPQSLKEIIDLLQKQIKGQKTLTDFLRSGRLL